jgi:uncharacterized phage-associated protein
MPVLGTNTITAQDVANYFLASVDETIGDNLSNLKLQKLLYYAQGLYLAVRDGAPLFPEEIKAWQYGPVVEEIYHEYKEYGANAIPAPESFDASKISLDVREILDEVATVYGQFSASRLMNMTHEEPPWKTTDPKAVITHDKMRDYFKTQLVDA